MCFPPPHYSITHGTEVNSWVGGRVCFLKLQSVPSYTFLSCHKYVDTPDLPRACVCTGFGSQLYFITDASSPSIFCISSIEEVPDFSFKHFQGHPSFAVGF